MYSSLLPTQSTTVIPQGSYQIFLRMGFYRSVKQFNFANGPIKISEKTIKALSWNYNKIKIFL